MHHEKSALQVLQRAVLQDMAVCSQLLSHLQPGRSGGSLGAVAVEHRQLWNDPFMRQHDGHSKGVVLVCAQELERGEDDAIDASMEEARLVVHEPRVKVRGAPL